MQHVDLLKTYKKQIKIKPYHWILMSTYFHLDIPDYPAGDVPGSGLFNMYHSTYFKIMMLDVFRIRNSCPWNS